MFDATSTLAQMVKFYNENCHLIGKHPVKKFADKKTALARVEPIIQATKAVSAPKKYKTRKPNVSSRCRELIAQGLDNKAIWTLIRDEFKLPESKSYYPAWNRAAIARRAKKLALAAI